MYQGVEIYLKDGRSYFFNLLSESNFDDFKNFLCENIELKQLIHRKDYLTKQKIITKAWETNLITTYEYLLFVNKYASRSFNDPNQYYIFPWIFKNTKYLNNINNLESYSDNQILNESLRDLKYPISLQNEEDRIMCS